MHIEHGLQFKSFVPLLVENLAHADGTIREAAKHNLVDLFKDAPERAKADLKRQLISQNVRKSIASHILSHINVSVPAELATAAPAPSHPPPAPHPARPDPAVIEVAVPHEPVLPPSANTSNIEPLYVDSLRQLEDMFRDMTPNFEGRESETNWMSRDSSVLKLRKLLKGNAPQDHSLALVNNLKQILEGILKVFNSLRTTMSSNGSQLVQEMAQTLGPSIDSMLEILMQNAVKLCSATKNISAQNGQATVDALLSNATYNVRLVQHIWFAAQDKNVQPRTFASGWLQTIMKRQAHSKAAFEHSGGLELAEKIIKKGLSDATPKVREQMRGTFWAFHATWPDRAVPIMDGLDAKSRTLLEKDASNPAASNSTFTSSVGPGSGPGNVRAAASRTTLKEQIAAQKKANLAAKRMPDRPNSAMANLSPSKPTGPSRPTSVMPGNSNKSTPSNSRPTTSGTSAAGQGSLMSGPVRRPKKPEVPRPATADPYANMNRRFGRAETPPSRSPANSPARGGASHVKSKSSSGLRPGTSDSEKSAMTSSPRVTPAKARPKTIHGGDASILRSSPAQIRGHGASPRSSFDEEASLRSGSRTRRLSRESDRPVSHHSDLPTMAEEDDNFTLVMPQKGGALELAAPAMDEAAKPREQSPLKMAKSPPKAPLGPREASAKKPAIDRPITPAAPVVYEDPKTAQEEVSSPEETPKVLEEVTNRQHTESRKTEAPQASNSGAGGSPMKRIAPRTGAETPQERAEVMKHRRLLSSGVERLRARTLDAHGFRRLQDLVKSVAGGSESEAYHRGLLVALAEYVEATPESLKVPASKAASLKGQALVTLRGLIGMRREEREVQEQCARVMQALLRARRMTDKTSGLNAELDRTGQEAVRSCGESTLACINAVAEAGLNQTSGEEAEQGGMVIAALTMLGQLLGVAQKREQAVDGARLKLLGQLAVRYLDHTSADVRRADTEFCLALHNSLAAESKSELWSLLEGAQEAQLNLIAYYLARKDKK